MTLTTRHTPTPGAPYSDKEAWLAQRRGGVTATEVRELAKGFARTERELLTAKLTGAHVNLDGNQYVDHGNKREPIIGQWLLDSFEIEPCELVYSGENPQHLASPDGLSVDFVEDGITSEIKTSKHDLHPGDVVDNVLVQIDSTSHFAKTGYYDQMQWQMHVMGGTRVLFAWEQHDDNWPDPKPVHERPMWCWVLRDQKRIDELVEIATKFLAKLAASSVDSLAPVSEADVDPHVADLAHRLLVHRDAEAVAKKQKEAVWKELQSLLMPTGTAADDVAIELAEAKITVSTNTTTGERKVVDMDAARKKAPALVQKYEALIERCTTTEPTSSTSTKLSVTAKKGS